MNETQEIVRQIAAYSYLGAFGLSLIANIFVPVPEEVVVLMIGYATGAGLLAFWPTLGIVFLGLLISDMMIYFFAKKGTRVLLIIYEKYFARLGIKDNEAFLKKNINSVIFFSRFIIQFRFLGPFLAGYFQIPFKRFLKFELPALMIYVPLVLWLGYYFQSRIDSVISGLGSVKNIIIIVVGIVLVISLAQYVKARFMFFLTHPSLVKIKNVFFKKQE